MRLVATGKAPRSACITLCVGIAGSLLAGCSGSSPAPAYGQASVPAGAQKSTNWSGYAQTGSLHDFTEIEGGWTVPTVQCGSAASASATWAGIGGDVTGDTTLIQAGTEQDCASGAANYYAWWEGYPAPSTQAGGPVGAGNYPVQAGDHMSVTIDGSSALVWTIKIVDATAGWTFSTTVPFVSAGMSAEWIEESPLSVGTSGAGQEALSKFGQVSFTALAANGANPALSSNQAVVLVDSGGKNLATPSVPKSGGDAFDVCYGTGGCQ